MGRPLWRDAYQHRATWTYDLADRLVSEELPGGTTTWTYDAAGRGRG